MTNKPKSIQIQLSIPTAWKRRLARKARSIAYEEDRDFTWRDLIRRALKETYCSQQGSEENK
jgi:hypothetical protein